MVILVLFLALFCIPDCQHANLVGTPEDTDGGVGGTLRIVLRARVYGYTDPAVALIASITDTADL